MIISKLILLASFWFGPCYSYPPRASSTWVNFSLWNKWQHCTDLGQLRNHMEFMHPWIVNIQSTIVSRCGTLPCVHGRCITWVSTPLSLLHWILLESRHLFLLVYLGVLFLPLFLCLLLFFVNFWLFLRSIASHPLLIDLIYIIFLLPLHYAQ